MVQLQKRIEGESAIMFTEKPLCKSALVFFARPAN
jgi:hypothetical protein